MKNGLILTDKETGALVKNYSNVTFGLEDSINLVVKELQNKDYDGVLAYS